MPARFMTLSLGATGINYLDAGEWQASVGFRYLHSDTLFRGTTALTQLGDAVVATIYSFDFVANYGITKRFSASLTLPVEYGQHTSAVEHDLIHRHETSAAGIGDLR